MSTECKKPAHVDWLIDLISFRGQEATIPRQYNFFDVKVLLPEWQSTRLSNRDTVTLL